MQPVIKGYESDGEPIEAVWIPIDKTVLNTTKNESKQTIRIYPKGIIELIKNNL
jgi:hypothetical protein